MKKASKSVPQENVYNSQETYRVGQHIYHSLFDDTGKIVKKMPAPGNRHLIVVQFKNVGEKKLISQGNQPEQDVKEN